MTEPVIVLEDVFATRDGNSVLDGVSLSVHRGEVMTVFGPSGAGKTTLLRIVLGLLAPTRGRVSLAGELVSVEGRILRPPEERNLGMVFQDLALWPHLSVHGNLAFGLAARGVARNERERRIDRVLRRVDLLEKRDRRPGSLSGGERQRVAIGRALVLDPVAVLLDEPLANLDIVLERQLIALFRELFAERQTTALYVTHDPREVARIADRVAVLREGRIEQLGTLAELRRQPESDFVRLLLEDLPNS